MGFCEDYKPDDKVYKIQEGFFISSQGGAQNLEELKRQKITHILNVGSGIENAFLQVRGLNSTYCVHENTKQHIKDPIQGILHKVGSVDFPVEGSLVS